MSATGIIAINGSAGEGGGQILRTSLALSLITGRPIAMHRIRAGRAKPGLQRQHLACVSAAALLCGTVVRDARVGSTTLELTPGEHWATELEIDIGTAGSATLVVQTILLPAILSGRPLRAVITGGTHNQMAPPFDYLDRVFLPHLRAMGADISLTLERHGLVPRGGGRIVLEVRPAPKLAPIALIEAGPVVARRVTAIVADLPRAIADREIARMQALLVDPTCEVREVAGTGPANVVMVEVELASGARELVTSHGRRGYPAERVAEDAIAEIGTYLDRGAPVGEHLADQLVLPMALAGGGRFRTAPLSRHATTNIATIQRFLDVPFRVDPDGSSVLVTVG